MVEGLKLAPPKALPIKLIVKTQKVFRMVVMNSPASEKGSRARKIAISVERIPSVEILKTHIDVKIASPMAAFITPIIPSSFFSETFALCP